MFDKAPVEAFKIDELPAIDRRGNVVYPNKVIRENYENAWPI